MNVNKMTKFGLIALVSGASLFALADGLGGMMGGDGGGRHGRHGGMREPMTPEKMQEFAQKRAEHFAKSVDATPDQTAKLIAIAKASGSQMQALQAKNVDARKKGMDLMSAPTLDRAAIERFQAEQAANHDQMRKIREKAMLDSQEVLTPEQRSKMAAKMKERMSKDGGRGGHGGMGAAMGDKKPN